MKYICSCCGNYTLEEPSKNSYEICPVCFWENDDLQNTDENFSGGANRISIKEARQNYINFGAIKESCIPYIRNATISELPFNNEKKTRN